jgi:hypothetical protein
LKALKIGIAELDTSRVPALPPLLHDSSNEYHVPRARSVTTFPDGSPDFELSAGRVGLLTEELRDNHGVESIDSLSELRGKCDAVMLESIDGWVHLPQFREVAQWGAPVFMDKPFTVSRAEEQEIVKIACDNTVLFASASALRFAEAFQQMLAFGGDDPVTGGDFYGPMEMQEKRPGYFWNGVHTAGILFSSMGCGCREVPVARKEMHDLVFGHWADGRIGTLRGNRVGNEAVGVVSHRSKSTHSFDAQQIPKPFYAILMRISEHFFSQRNQVHFTCRDGHGGFSSRGSQLECARPKAGFSLKKIP